MSVHAPTRRVEVLGTPGDRHDEILTPEALDFITRLDDAFRSRRLEVLKERVRRSTHLAGGTPLVFPLATRAIRHDSEWRVAPPAPGLTDRRVEITGPPDRRMAVDALNSGARVWMADLEDATSPTWDNVIGGQLTLLDVIERRIDFTTPGGREYRLGSDLATIMVRPRGWHLLEEHLEIDGRPVSASLVDFGLYFLHKEREAEDGFDGSWVAHPGLAPVCREVFDDVLGKRPNQLERTREDAEVTAAEPLSVRRITAPPTSEGIRSHVAVALRYFDAWLRGRGAVALNGLMEDAATAEIARVQIWQWLRHDRAERSAVLDLLDAECEALAEEDPQALVTEARELFVHTALSPGLPAFFTPGAYTRHLVRRTEARS
ncbi:hypothetical protein [Streptomyces sp. NPDC020817]|uniref:hypothetical protein n=1 Tax=Streptomyces sp. NPDC020817 TaxID=3365095 RepID=UPI0037BA408E